MKRGFLTTAAISTSAVRSRKPTSTAKPAYRASTGSPIPASRNSPFPGILHSLDHRPTHAPSRIAFVATYTGDGFADFLLGYPDNVQRAYFRNLWGNNGNFHGFYVQDDYRIASNFTINAGLRWEINPFYNAVRGQISSFDWQTGKL